MQPRKNVVASRDKLIVMMLVTFNLSAIQAFFTRTAVEVSLLETTLMHGGKMQKVEDACTP